MVMHYLKNCHIVDFLRDSINERFSRVIGIRGSACVAFLQWKLAECIGKLYMWINFTRMVIIIIIALKTTQN